MKFLSPDIPHKSAVDGVRLNEDVVALRAASSFDAGLAMINPYCLLSPIAPHIAAAEEGVCIEPTRILAAADALRQQAEGIPACMLQRMQCSPPELMDLKNRLHALRSHLASA